MLVHLLTINRGTVELYCILVFILLWKLSAFYSVGIVFYYGIFQLGVWWFCHVVSLFWVIRFPFHFRSFKAAHRLKYVHIIMVVVGLVLPTLPVILPFTTGDPNMRGFGLTTFPPTNCDRLQGLLTFFSLPLPINLLLVTGIPLLIIVLWIVHKVKSYCFWFSDCKLPIMDSNNSQKLRHVVTK